MVGRVVDGAAPLARSPSIEPGYVPLSRHDAATFREKQCACLKFFGACFRVSGQAGPLWLDFTFYE